MEDRPAIVNFLLSNHYIKENHALELDNALLQDKVKQLQIENRTLTRRITSRNHQIAILEERIQFNDFQHERQMRMQRILVSVDGSCHVFRRQEDGVFIQVMEDPDATDTEVEEEPEEIARRLGFESDSDGYISDDLMRSLLEDE